MLVKWISESEEEKSTIPELVQEFESEFNQLTTLRYIAYQLERGGVSERLHWQAYLEFHSAIRPTQVGRAIPGAQLQPRMGTRDEAISYCSKELTRVVGPFEYGHAPRQGHRSDLCEIRDRFKGGAREEEIAEEYFGQWVRYHGAFKRYKSMVTPKRTWKTEVIVFWGVPGSGKTYRVWEEAGGYDSVWTLENPNGPNLWFDGYDGQSTVLIDDFYGWAPFSLMLKLTDAYPMRVAVKGAMVQWAPKKMYITSNVSWEDWYDFDKLYPTAKEAFRRRITHVEHFTEKWGGIMN